MKFIVKLLYKPFGIVFGIVGGLVARTLFRTLWSWIDREEPPTPKTDDAPWGKVVTAAALQAATFAGSKAATERAGMQTFRYLFGAWPGDRAARD